MAGHACYRLSGGENEQGDPVCSREKFVVEGLASFIINLHPGTAGRFIGVHTGSRRDKQMWRVLHNRRGPRDYFILMILCILVILAIHDH